MAAAASSLYQRPASSPLGELSDDMAIDSDSSSASAISAATPVHNSPSKPPTHNTNDDSDLDADANGEDVDADADGDADAEADPDYADDENGAGVDSPMPYLTAGGSSRVSSKVCRFDL